MQSWLYILLFMIIAVVVPFAAILTARILGPENPTQSSRVRMNAGWKL